MRIVRFIIRTTAIREWREQRRVAQMMPAVSVGKDAGRTYGGSATATTAEPKR